MSTRSKRAAHDIEVEPVVGAVDDDGRAFEGARERLAVACIHLLPAFEPKVPARHFRPPLLEEAGDIAPDRPRCTDDRDHAPIEACENPP